MKLELIDIPAGIFLYGENKEEIRTHAFSIMKYPVTVHQYRIFCMETRWRMPDPPSWGLIDNHPIVNISCRDAKAFAKWAGGSLPTELQWEKAARGTDGRAYPWGHTTDEIKGICSIDATRSSTAPVGSCPDGASPYGCQDMIGNVWEWCSDYWDSCYTSHVIRGGSWAENYTQTFRITCRGRFNLDGEANDVGFRIVVHKTN